MKKISVMLLGLALVVSLSACGKQPTEEMNATRAAIDAAVSEGAEKYTPEDLKAVNDQMEAAMAEIKVQDDKFFKNYDKAKEALAKAKADADSLKSKVATVKEEMKNSAIALLGEATTAIADAKTALESAPRGKGSLADIEAMKADVAGLEEALNEIQPLIDAGEYASAVEKATAIQSRAVAVSDEIKAVQEKLSAAKK
jgi:chromosome segregation ATPase